MKRNALLFGLAVSAAGIVLSPASADPNPYREGTLRVRQTYEADFDSGTTSTVGQVMPGADLWFDAADWSHMFLTPKNGAQFGDSGELQSGKSSPYNLCKSISLTPAPVNLAYVQNGHTICYRTSDGRLGFFFIADRTGDAANKKPVTLRLFFRTWQ